MSAATNISAQRELQDRLNQMEHRISRLERHLGVADAAEPAVAAEPPQQTVSPETSPDEEDLEQVVGQRWFAHVGILVLALGAAFALARPYSSAAPALPSLIGYAATGALFLLARLWQDAFALISSYLRGAAMALLYFSTLRLYYFGSTAVLSTDVWMGQAVLIGVVIFNLVLALKRGSGYLLALGLVMGYVTLALVDAPWLMCFGVGALSVFAVFCWRRFDLPALLLLGIPAGYLTHLLWMLGDSLWSGEFEPVLEPRGPVFCVLLYGVVFGLAPLFRGTSEPEDSLDVASALFNAGSGYGLYLLHAVLAFHSAIVALQLLAAVVYLALAAVLWRIRRSELACFVYAMTGYLALSVAILSTFAVPGVFVWLSLQSVLVLATALWFRSPFIVVGNFFIYLAVVAGYLVVARQETGISLGFGLVALISARVLNWQRERLQLKTEKMRNAYLLSALLVFPYALYHLVPRAYVALSWVAVAGVYYLLNVLIRNQKYRWMGHLTLLLTVLYLLVIGIIELTPLHRVLSFLVLGTVLVVVSLLLTRRRSTARLPREG